MADDFELLSLLGPTGKVQENNPDDIEALDGSLRKIGAYSPPPEYAETPQRYATGPMIDALERYQEQNRLKIDGVANPGGSTERAINNRLLRKPRGAGLLYEPPAPITDTVGNGFKNERKDVADVQRRLGALGYLPEDPFDQPHGFIDEPTTKAIKRFQADTGLTPDGWLAPGGETERVLEDALSKLARAHGRDWFNFVDRAARAQAAFTKTLENRTEDGETPKDRLGKTLDYRPDTDTDVGLVPAQGRGVPGVGPSPRLWPPVVPIPGEEAEAEDVPGSPRSTLRFLGERILRRANPGAHRPTDTSPRQDIDEDQKSGGRLENIHPPASREPYGGRDPIKPPLSPELTAPSPYPSDRPQLPNKTENIPLRPKRGDHIIVLPDPSDVIGRQPIIVENRQGSPATKALNRSLAEPVLGIGKDVFGEGSIEQIGGPTADENEQYKESFDRLLRKKDFGITSNAGGSFEDVSYIIRYHGVDVKFVINTVTSGADGDPIARENRQRAKMVLNIEEHAFIAEVDKPRPGETIDPKAWREFIGSRMRYIKRLIDDKVITEKGPNQKLLDFFRIYGGR